MDAWNKTDKANCGENGFHCAENPLDCLSYYRNWRNSVYYEVEAAGDLDEDEFDSKISCTEIYLLKRLTLEQLLFVFYENNTWNHIIKESNKKNLQTQWTSTHYNAWASSYVCYDTD